MQLDITQSKKEQIIRNGLFLQFYNSVSNIEKALMLTKGVIWETGDSVFPYQLAGTIAPICFQDDFYLLTAKHVAVNIGIHPSNSMYCFQTKDALSYDEILNWTGDGKISEKRNDFLLLKVKKDAVFDLLAKEDVFSLSSNVVNLDQIIDVYIRGCPCPINFKGTEIDFELNKISQQCFRTNGFLNIKRADEYDGCYWLKMKNPVTKDFSNDPQGMSGSIVYYIDDAANADILGMIIEYNRFTQEYLLISSQSIYHSCVELKQ